MVRDICNFILGYFLHFYPPNSPKNQNKKKKMKKTPGDVLILHMCTKLFIRLSLLKKLRAKTFGSRRI